MFSELCGSREGLCSFHHSRTGSDSETLNSLCLMAFHSVIMHGDQASSSACLFVRLIHRATPPSSSPGVGKCTEWACLYWPTPLRTYLWVFLIFWHLGMRLPGAFYTDLRVYKECLSHQAGYENSHYLYPYQLLVWLLLNVSHPGGCVYETIRFELAFP